MRTEILRSPETDRKKVLVPTALTDLTDYAATICYASLAQNVERQAAFGAGSYNIPFDTTVSLRNCVGHTEGVLVQVGGLFIVQWAVGWFHSAGGSFIGPATSSALRSSGLSKNGSGVALAVNSALNDGFDSGSGLLRLAAGDYLEVKATNLDGTAGTGRLFGSTLQLSKLAP